MRSGYREVTIEHLSRPTGRSSSLTLTVRVSPPRWISTSAVLARLEARDRAREVVGVRDRLIADLGDDVAAAGERLALEDLLPAPAAQPGLGRGPARRDLLHPHALVHLEPEMLDQLRIQRHRGHAEVGVARPALLAQLPDRALDDVDRHREPDALAAAGARLDLLVDPDHAPVGADQRPAGVARVDRGVGLDRARDREVGQRRHGAVDGRDDPDATATAPVRMETRSPRPARRPRPSRCRRAAAASGPAPSSPRAAARRRRSGRARAPSRPRGCRRRTRRRPPRRA